MKLLLLTRLPLFVLTFAFPWLGGCVIYREIDATADYVKDPAFHKGYKVGAVYELQTDLFVTQLERPHYLFTRPGGYNLPTIAAWEGGNRKSNFFKIIGPIRAGAKIRVEKVISIRSRNGIDEVTCMFRAEGFELLISPFGISHFIDIPGGFTLCVPNSVYLKEVP